METKPRVVHFKRTPVPGMVYIGRGSKWGNPFTHREGTAAQWIVSSREEAITCYEAWLMTQPSLLAALPELRGKTLGCWCAPLACHGDVLLRLANAPVNAPVNDNDDNDDDGSPSETKPLT